MKRYRLSNFFFDGTRALLKDDKIPADKLVKEREQLKKHIAYKYGEQDIANKLKRYIDYEIPNISAISEYTSLLVDISDAYVSGNYYATLTGACSLGERIFNFIILKVRIYFTKHPLYKTVYRKKSFQDWDKAITVLKEWQIIDTEIEEEYRRLASLRNESIHFGDIEAMAQMSLDALKIIMKITNKLFGLQSEYFFWCPGELYIKKGKEELPFVKEFVIPNCILLGYKHKTEGEIDNRGAIIRYKDSDDYAEGDEELSDEEFRQHRITWQKEQNI